MMPLEPRGTQFTIPLYTNYLQRLPLISSASPFRHWTIEKRTWRIYISNGLLSERDGHFWNWDLCVASGASWHGQHQTSGQPYTFGLKLQSHPQLLNRYLIYSANGWADQGQFLWPFILFSMKISWKTILPTTSILGQTHWTLWPT